MSSTRGTDQARRGGHDAVRTTAQLARTQPHQQTPLTTTASARASMLSDKHFWRFPIKFGNRFFPKLIETMSAPICRQLPFGGAFPLFIDPSTRLNTATEQLLNNRILGTGYPTPTCIGASSSERRRNTATPEGEAGQGTAPHFRTAHRASPPRLSSLRPRAPESRIEPTKMNNCVKSGKWYVECHWWASSNPNSSCSRSFRC